MRIRAKKKKYIYIYIAEDVHVVAWQQRNKASMTSDKRIEHGKQRGRTVNGTRTIERTFYQHFWFQRRRSETAKSLTYTN